MKSRVYIVDDVKMKFNFNNFKIYFDTYCNGNKVRKYIAEKKIADELSISVDAVHKWRYGKSSPNYLELVKQLAAAINVNDYQKLLKSVDGGNSNMKLNERQVTAVKKIYDICIWFLMEFDNTDGFNEYWYTLQDKGIENPEDAIVDMVDNMHRKIELVLEQEFFDLRNTDIYNELCEFVSDDLIDIYDGKLSYAYRTEALADGNPTTSEDYGNAMIKLNGIIEKYV